SRPGVSRKSIAAGVVLRGRNFAESQSRRASGTLALPAWPICALAGSGLAPVSHWKTVLLPDPANPTMPTFMACSPWPVARATPVMYSARRGVTTGPRHGRSMCDQWMSALKLPLSWEQFCRLPRHPAYKYEYFEDTAWLSPRPRYYHALLDLAPLADAPREGADTKAVLRPVDEADWEGLAPLFAAAFERQQPFGGLEDEPREGAARKAL